MLKNFIDKHGWLYVFKDHLFILFLFTLLIIIMTYPFIFEITNKVPGDFDSYWFLWILWRFKTDFTTGSDLFYTKLIFYPSGSQLYLSATMPLLSFLSIPLQNYLGLFGAYNLLFLLSYILAGYFMYWLAKYVLKDSKAAFLAALIFAFSPYHSAHAFRHLNLMSIQFIPMFFLFYLKFREKPTMPNVFLAALSFAVIGYSEMIYFAMCVIYIIFDFTYLFLAQKVCPSKIQIRQTLLFLSLTLLILAPYLVGIVHEVFFVEYYPSSDLNFLHSFSADLLSFIIPPWFNPLLSPYFSDFYPILERWNNLLDVEGIVFIGFSILFLIIYAWDKIYDETLKKWKWLLIASFILTLGPFLIIFGKPLPILLPYFYTFFLIPFFWLLRVPARFDVFIMLAAAILAGFGYLEIQKRLSKQRILQLTLPYLLSIVILFEFWAPIPYFIDSNVNIFYKKLFDDGLNYVIFDIPHERSSSFSPYNSYLTFTQTIHNKKMVGGALSRTPIHTSEFTEQPCIKNLATLNFSNQCSKEEYNQRLGNDIRYIIYHKNAPYWLNPKPLSDTTSLENIFGRPVFEDKELVVYCRFNCTKFT